MDCHANDSPRYCSKILGVLRRYVSEALILDRMRKMFSVMNGKSEWGKVKLPRINVIRTGEDDIM